ncbi:MAG: hypothetical protein FWG35_07525, partial [Spirochaetaceae bacterium]|nr:hypothetical protein [Spirochaetaceae bacterium]
MNPSVSRFVRTFACAFLLAFFATGLEAAPPARTETPGGSKVYFTQDISARGVLEAYKRLGVSVSGKVAIKLHMGEDGNANYLRPELLRDLVTSVKGT